MAYIEPNTTVQFLNVPYDPDYENTMYWESLSEQNTYMETKILYTISNNSYQRKDKGVLRVGWVADTTPGNSVIKTLYASNYMRFRNTNYENKWFYAFVKQVEYVNNNTVDVFYELDVLQTWALDYTLLDCFVERNHTPTDVLGEHTVPEGLEHGEYFDTPLEVASSSQTGNASQVGNNHFEYTPAVCLITTFDAQGNYTDGTIIHGQAIQGDMFSGLFYTIYQLTAANLTALNDTLEAISGNSGTGLVIISKDGVKVPKFLADGVVALFMMPWEFAASITGQSVAPAVTLGFDVRTNGSYLLGNYQPRNKKLLCYPYNMFYISNNQGGDAELRWEDFSTALQAQIQIWGNVSPNGGMTCIPMSYKGYTGRNPNEMLQLTGFPMCSWAYDSYKAWVAQNAATIGASILGIASQWANFTVGTQMLPSGGVIGSTLGAVGQVFDHKRKSPQAEGNGNTNLTYQSGLLTFYFYRKHIKEEYAKIIDAYFDMYGYKVNRVGTPSRNVRDCWTYVKTIGCAVDGLLPAEDAKKIEGLFDKGIRFWRPTATFGVYSPLINDNQVHIVG